MLQNDSSNQPDNGVETRTDDETMSFYNERDIGFYYSLAETFAIHDRYFSSVLERPSTRLATISSWICWVPSKMSRILASRAHFSSSSPSP